MNTVKTTSKTAPLPLAATRFVIRAERGSDVAAREALLDVCFGEGRDARTCQRLRDGRLPAEGLVFTAVVKGKLVGTVRLWHVSAGGRAALVLGPLAVDPSCQKLGIGGVLMRHAIEAARRLGHSAIILLGDAPYYARFGFQAEKAAELHLPGSFERERLLGLELRDAALDGAWGMIAPTGKPVSQARGLRSARQKRLVTKAA
jgi:predicted N-acetyltransferase YhbS